MNDNSSDNTGTYTGTYTGRVTPGGKPQVLELERILITKLAVDEKMNNNCYVLTCRGTGEQLLIDAADEADAILQIVGPGPLSKVVTTHQHWDHHRALAQVVAATRAETLVGDPDADAVTEQTGVPVDRRLLDGDEVTFGDVTLQVIAVAGHTPGSVCLRYDDPDGETHLFTGDCLFPGGVGATFGDATAFAQLIDDVEHKIFDRLPDATAFHPGHGDDGRISEERPHVEEWRQRGW